MDERTRRHLEHHGLQVTIDETLDTGTYAVDGNGDPLQVRIGAVETISRILRKFCSPQTCEFEASA